MSEISFNNLEVGEPVIKKRFKMQSTPIDKHNIKRSRVELTPSMCLKANCNFDIAKANKFESWHQVPIEERTAMIKALEKHVLEVHTIAEEIIIQEDQMPKKYLGSIRQF